MIMIWLTCSRILRHPGNHLARPWCTLWGPEYTWTSWFCQIFPPCQLGRKCCSYIMYRCTGVLRSNIFFSNMLQILPSFISRYQKSEIPKGFFFKMWYVHIRDDEYVFFRVVKITQYVPDLFTLTPCFEVQIKRIFGTKSQIFNDNKIWKPPKVKCSRCQLVWSHLEAATSLEKINAGEPIRALPAITTWQPWSKKENTKCFIKLWVLFIWRNVTFDLQAAFQIYLFTHRFK